MYGKILIMIEKKGSITLHSFHLLHAGFHHQTEVTLLAVHVTAASILCRQSIGTFQKISDAYVCTRINSIIIDIMYPKSLIHKYEECTYSLENGIIFYKIE